MRNNSRQEEKNLFAEIFGDKKTNNMRATCFLLKSLFRSKRLVQCQLFYIRAVDALPMQFLLLIDSSLLI